MKVLCSPHTKDVEEHLSKRFKYGEKTLHIVPTKILERRRRIFYKEILRKYDEHFLDFRYYELSEREQSDLLKKHGVYIFELHSFFDDLLIDLKINHLTNREASVYIERALKQFENLSNKPWLDNISGILNFFTQIKIGEIYKKAIEPSINITTWNTLMEIFSVYEDMMKERGVIDKADAYLVLLDKLKKESYSQVYIDGAFLPFSPLLNQLIRILPKEKINFFIPYNLEQKGNLKYKVLEQTYGNVVPVEQWENIKQTEKNINMIHRIANNLFEDELVELTDRTLGIKKFDSSEEEIRDVVNEISEFIKAGIVSPEKIAIVSTNPMELRRQVNEYLEIYNLYETKVEKELIDYPIGKVIFILYQIFIDERIGMFNNADHFIDEEMVGDLLHVIEVTKEEKYYDTFNKLKAFFSECFSFEGWYQRLDKLDQARHLDLHLYKEHPLNFIDDNQIKDFKNFLRFIEEISTTLINQEPRSFIDHLNHLFRLIKNTENLRKLFVESDLVVFEEKIKEFSATQMIGENITITPYEFGSRLHSILTEVQEVDEIDEPPLDKVAVTGPNNIEYQEYENVYILQFTQTKFPEKHIYTWPMNEEFDWIILNHSKNSFGITANSITEYYTYRSLYYFFITLNSTDKKLTITYSEKYNSETASPSHFLFDLSKLLIPNEYYGDIIKHESNIEDALERTLEHINYLKKTSSMNRGKFYKPEFSTDLLQEKLSVSTEELINYQRCPRQFYYSKKYSELNYYSEKFQLFHYAVGCIYEKVVQLLVKKRPLIQFKTKSSIEFLKKDFEYLFQEAKEQLEPLFLLPRSDWKDIYARAKYLYENLITYIFNRKGSIESIELSWNETIDLFKLPNLEIEGKVDLKVKDSDGRVRNCYVSNFKNIFMLKGKERSKLINLQEALLNLNDKDNKELKSIHEQISNNKFQKKYGDHCMYCSFKHWCLRKEVSFN